MRGKVSEIIDMLNESVVYESVSTADIKGIHVGSVIHHKDLGKVEVVEVVKANNDIYNKPYGFSSLEVKASDGNEYGLYVNTETLRVEKRIGDEIKKWTKVEN